MGKLFKYSLLIALLVLQSTAMDARADKLAQLRTKKKIVPVNEISSPYYAIQILAIKKPPQNPSYFKNVNQAREFACNDGYVRYTVGSYSSKEEACNEIKRIKAKGYTECFVVDIRDYNLDGSYSKPGNFTPDGQTTYTVQIAALRYPVYVDHFDEFDDVKEFYPDDRIYRYTVGEYSGDEALKALNRIKSKGYPQAHLVPLRKYTPYRIE